MRLKFQGQPKSYNNGEIVEPKVPMDQSKLDLPVDQIIQDLIQVIPQCSHVSLALQSSCDNDRALMPQEIEM